MRNAIKSNASTLRADVVTRGGTLITLTPSFFSFYDLFSQAMDEAEDYYDRMGGYEEFKEKYPKFYYPEVGDDYAAYIPMSDKNAAKIADQNGNVIVGNELVSLKDIDNYEQLKALGRTFPEDDEDVVISTRAGEVLYTNTTPNLYNSGDRNRFRVKTNVLNTYYTIHDVVPPIQVPALFVEVIFRKKGVLGVYYNHSSTSTCTLDANTLSVVSYTSESPINMTGFSSHNRYYRYNPTMVGVNRYPALDGTITVYHQGTDRSVTLKVIYPDRAK